MKQTFVILALLALLLSCSKKPEPKVVTADPGKQIYVKYCLPCHQTNASGVPGMFPPLLSTDWVQGDKSRLIQLLLKGQQGKIKVNGKPFKGVMPPHAYLTDEQIAEVLSFVRSNFGNNAPAVTATDVAAARQAGP